VLKVNWHNAEIMYDGDSYYSSEFLSSLFTVGTSLPSLKESTTVRMEFPETWLWSESVTGYQPSDV